jgi:hypothetical protein
MSLILYKEYFNEDEAAEYVCMSKSAFNEQKDSLGIVTYRLPGFAKNMYKRAELQMVLESGLKPWQPHTNEEESGISNGAIQKASIALASRNTELKRRRMRKTSGSQKNSNLGPAQQ